MAHGEASERIRRVAWTQVIEPQIRRGQRKIDVAIKPLMKQLEAEGFDKNRPRQFCKALQKGSFLAQRGLVLDGIDGPPSGTSTTVILHFRLAIDGEASSVGESAEETPDEWARRVTEPIRGLMKEKIAAHGGTEGYLRWVRSEDSEGAA